MNAVAFLHGLSLVSYLGAGGLVAGSLAAGRSTVLRGAVGLIATALVFHAIAIVSFVLRFGELPLVGLAASFSSLAFLIGASLLAAALLREIRPLALVLIPLIALLLAFAITLGVAPSGASSQFRGIWFTAHVVMGFVGYACLAVAFAAGLLYLLQFRALKDKRFGRAFRFFPPLDTLDRVRQRVLWTGLPALSFALILGWAWTVRFQNSLAAGNPQVIWGVVTWAVFAAALAARWKGDERRAAAASVVGFAVVVIAYLALRLSMADGAVFL
jgi:HemX protein